MTENGLIPRKAARASSYHYDASAAIRPQNSMAVRPCAQVRYDANKGKSMISIRPVTFSIVYR